MPTDPLGQISELVEIDPRPVDDTYRVHVQKRDRAANIRWLKDFAEQREFGRQTQPGPGDSAGRAPDKPAPARTTGEIVMDTLADVGKGVTEAPSQAVGGAADAVNAMLDGISDLPGVALSVLIPGFRREAGKRTGEDILGSEALAEAVKSVDVPTTEGAESVTGGAVRGISQFLTGFVVGGKFIKGGSVAANIGKGVFADFAAFDGHEQRLSDLIQEFPELENPITEFLASDEDDPEIVGRLKNVVEGIGGDVVFAGLLRGLGAIREARKAKAVAGGETFAKAAERAALEATGSDLPALRGSVDLRPLTGDPEKPLMEIREIATGVPDDVTARAATPEGLSRVDLGDREIFINFARINSTDDIKGLVADMADAFAGDINVARRGKRSNVETIEAAGDENAWALLSERRMGDALNAEQTLAVRGLWASSAESLGKLAKAATDSPSPENLFAFRRAFALHSAIQKEAISVRTETARALQQWGIPAGGSTETFRDIESIINVHGGVEVSEDLARRIAILAEDGNQGAIDYMARKGALAATGEAVREYWINALLSGPKTHMVNTLSNSAVAMLSVVERALAERIGDVLQGGARTQMGEAMAMVHGFTQSGRDAFANAWQSLKTGETGFGVQKLEGPRVRSISSEILGNTRNETFNEIMNKVPVARATDVIGSVVTLPGRALGAEDEFFKTINYRMEVHAQAFRQASADVESGAIPRSEFKERLAELTDNPPESVRLNAADFASYNTFTRAPGEITKTIQRAVGKIPFAKYIAPFINTPGNIMKFTFERTPLAPLSAKIRAEIAAGGARRDLALSRIALGSTMMLTAYDLGLNGQVTGSGPDNWREKSNLRRMGWQPYSIKFNDRYYAYNRLDPIGTLLGLGADLSEYAANTDDDPNSEYEEAVMQSILVAGENVMSKTYLYGLSQLVGALKDPQRFGPSYFERFAGSFVPTGVAEFTRFNDPHFKHTSNIVQKLKSRVPGLSADVPDRHDLWGRPISFQSGLSPVYDAISPIYSSEFKPEPADLELDRLGYFPGPPTKSIGIRLDGKSERVSLRNLPEVYQRYVVLTGGTPASKIGRPLTPAGNPSSVARALDSYGDMTVLEYINAVVTGEHEKSAEYAIMTDDEKAGFLSKVLRNYRAGARATLLEEFEELMEFRQRMDE